jgi:hypothetical protein
MPHGWRMRSHEELERPVRFAYFGAGMAYENALVGEGVRILLAIYGIKTLLVTGRL